jgi:hypothetical protein
MKRKAGWRVGLPLVALLVFVAYLAGLGPGSQVSPNAVCAIGVVIAALWLAAAIRDSDAEDYEDTIRFLRARIKELERERGDNPATSKGSG